MNTRMELWKEYRESIEKNNTLQKAVLASNKKLKILHDRLLKIYPDYDIKHKSSLLKYEATIKKIENIPSISYEKLHEILDAINELELSDNLSYSKIDSISFVDESLVKVLDTLKDRNSQALEYIHTNEEEEIFSEVKEIKLGGVMREKYRIAIDGPSGSGKSTIAKRIAELYGLKYINTGLVYRAIAFEIIRSKINPKNEEEVSNLLNNIRIKMLPNEVIDLNGEEITLALRSDEVSQVASIVASYPKVRDFAVNIQKEEANKESVIMDGRDTTFKIMPDADIKIFLDTSAEVRAKRRVDQNKKLGYSIDYDEILKEIKIRDKRDRTRSVDPLHKTDDAHLIDASDMSIDEVVEKIKEIIRG